MARALAAATRGDFHPSPEDLHGYQAGDLEREHADRVLRHLAACPECTRTVLDMETFPEVELVDKSRGLTAADVAERWARFEERLQQEAPPASETPDLVARIVSWLSIPWHSLSFARAAVAVLLVVTVGLSWTLLSRRQPVENPLINLALVELAPLAVSGQRGEAPVVRLAAEAQGVVLTLALLDSRTFPAYAIEVIAEATGDSVWQSRELRRSFEGIFTVQLPRRLLSAGTYRIGLRGIDGDREEPLASYRLELMLE